MAPDAYPVLQEGIVPCLRDKDWLSVFDIPYYQRRVHQDNVWKLTVVSHRGNEAFNVAPIGLLTSLAHQQRYMDKLLWRFRWRVACCFVDDIIIFSATFDDHLRDLNDVLTVLESADLSVQPAKCFAGRDPLPLLGQMVGRCGLMTAGERALAICGQQHPETLERLEYIRGRNRLHASSHSILCSNQRPAKAQDETPL
jgi:Reverse transcriptase (RNA-dependent DNA polymerase)